MCEHRIAKRTLTFAIAMIGATKVQCARAAVKRSPIAVLVRPSKGRVHDLICLPMATPLLPAKSGKEHRILHAMTCLAGMALWPISVHADTTVWSDLNGTPSYYNGNVKVNKGRIDPNTVDQITAKNSAVGNFDFAVPFTTPGNKTQKYDVNRIDVAVGTYSGDNAFKVIITTALKNGTKLFSSDFTANYNEIASRNANTLDTININPQLNKPPSLQLKGGTQYYIEILPLSDTSTTMGFWNLNSTGVKSTVYQSNDNGANWDVERTGQTAPAFDILSNNVVANPGPTMGAGLSSFPIACGAYWFINRRRRKTNPMFVWSPPVIG